MPNILIMPCSNGKFNYPFIKDGKEYKVVANPINEDQLSLKDIQNIIKEQKDEHLIEAYKLYKNKNYRTIYNHYKDNLYIYSALFGLINANFKICSYNATFSKTTAKGPLPSEVVVNKDTYHYDFGSDIGNKDLPIDIAVSKNYIKPLLESLSKYVEPNRLIRIHSKSEDTFNIAKKIDYFTNIHYIKYDYKQGTNVHYTIIKEHLLGERNEG